MWHRRKAFESMADYLDRGDRFIQCIQGEQYIAVPILTPAAQILITGLDHFNAWWVMQ